MSRFIQQLYFLLNQLANLVCNEFNNFRINFNGYFYNCLLNHRLSSTATSTTATEPAIFKTTTDLAKLACSFDSDCLDIYKDSTCKESECTCVSPTVLFNNTSCLSSYSFDFKFQITATRARSCSIAPSFTR